MHQLQVKIFINHYRSDALVNDVIVPFRYPENVLNVNKTCFIFLNAENPEVSHWPQFVEATCTLEHCSSFAAIWRLKSFTFSRHTSVAPEFTCVVPDYPDISVEIPLHSVPVGQDFSLTLKVLSVIMWLLYETSL